MGLEERWPLPRAVALRDALLGAYGAPGRGYHDLLHLAEVLDRLDELRADGTPFDGLTVGLAAWFHDAVYDGAPAAEDRSARWAARALVEVGLPEPAVAAVARLVRLTERHDPGTDDVDGAALCDADLAVLASGPERYEAYVDGVRHEYAHVPDPAFRAGRAVVLRALVERPRLFTTAHGRARWESAARANLARELASLTAQR